MATTNNNTKQSASEAKYGIDPDRDFDLCNVASNTDLTGLIPSIVIDRSEHVSYGEMYEYQPEDVVVPTPSFDATNKLK